MEKVLKIFEGLFYRKETCSMKFQKKDDGIVMVSLV